MSGKTKPNMRPDSLDRRRFMGAAALGGVGAAIGSLAAAPAQAAVQFPTEPYAFASGGAAAGAVHRSENDLFDCEIEGELPDDLDGVFYRVGPDPQYPKPEAYKFDIPFDGEGHLSMFRIKDGHVDYRSRYVRTQRWKAQHAARKSLFGMYRNPGTDDPSVKGLSRGTANTQIFYHHKTLLAMKEDSPPVALDPLTLDTVDDYYNFGGGMQGQTFTAHPKLDPVSGELVCFGYEAKGFLTRDIEIFTVAPDGKVNWRTFAKAPYAGMIHDFAVTQKHIAFLIVPLASNAEIIKQGGPHFAWDSKLPSYVGVMPRGGDGKDMRWYKGPAWMATHTMGAWSDGDKVYIDMDGADGNQFPFFPSLHEPFNPQNLQGNIVRLTVDFSKKSGGYEKKILFPDVTGVLSRQDDRYHTIPYRYGFINAFGSESAWVMVDHQTGKVSRYAPGPDAQLNEACFVPRKKSAGEGDGYLIGVVNRLKENGRSDLLLVDTKNLEAGPVAIVKMPYRVVGQVHGFWVAGDDLPAAA